MSMNDTCMLTCHIKLDMGLWNLRQAPGALSIIPRHHSSWHLTTTNLTTIPAIQHHHGQECQALHKTTTLGAKVSQHLLSMPAYTNIHFGFFRLERGEEEMEEYDIRLLSTKMHQNAHRFFIQNQDKPGVSQPRSSLVSFIGVFERISGQSQETEQ